MPLQPSNQIHNSLELENVSINYGSVMAVNEVNLHLNSGEIGCLLGPSGCGKSTLLRAIAGFEALTNGSISVGNRVLSKGRAILSPEQRNVGMVFQDIALFPHLTVTDNVAFGLTQLPNSEKSARVSELLELIGLPGCESRYPNSLSGGQQQRVALARALAPKPNLLLLDEPFSGLDAALKESLVEDVRSILLKENITALVVTHDQMEAFVIADKIAVMNKGRIEQFSAAYDVYHQPQTRFVADFIGQGYFISATILGDSLVNTELGVLNTSAPIKFKKDSEVSLLLRPDDIVHDDDSDYVAVITKKVFKGTYFQYEVVLSNGQSLTCIASSHHNHALGQRIGIKMELDHFVMFPKLDSTS